MYKSGSNCGFWNSKAREQDNKSHLNLTDLLEYICNYTNVAIKLLDNNIM